MPLIKRFQSAWQRYTLSELLQLIGKNVYYYSTELFSGRLFKKADETSEFDDAYNTETEKIREVGSLEIESENVKHAKRYQPSPKDFTTEIIHALPIDFSQYAFLDFGAGKGRVLLIAAQLPFNSVIGIEFCKELSDVATDNINKFAPEKRKAERVECLYEDVTLYSLPEMPLVCYFYNPFNELIMQAVLDRLISSLKANPREIYIIYVDPKHRDIFDKNAYFDAFDESDFHITYRSHLQNS
jgi:SAM-dependent methyltransferase